MKLLDLVNRESIVAEMSSTDRTGVIRELVQVLSRQGVIGEDAVEGVVKSIVTRERTRGPTGFGKGVALPHAKVEGLARVVAAVGRSGPGVDFEALDGEPVHGVFLVLSPADPAAHAEHLQAMHLIFRNLQDERFRKFLRQADRPEKVYDLLKESDEKLAVA